MARDAVGELDPVVERCDERSGRGEAALADLGGCVGVVCWVCCWVSGEEGAEREPEAVSLDREEGLG